MTSNMNSIATFRKCTLTDEELIKRVDELTDNMFREYKVPPRHVPARPDKDYDLLVGEMILRFSDKVDKKSEGGCDRCGGRIGLISGSFSYEPDMEPYQSGVEEDALFSGGDSNVCAYKCDRCGHLQGFWAE